MEGRGEWKKVMKILKRLFSIVYVCWVSVQKHAKVKTEIFSVCKTWCFRQKKTTTKQQKCEKVIVEAWAKPSPYNDFRAYFFLLHVKKNNETQTI